ncbi:MAG TPA: hypothetical protein VFZ77_11880 [Acidimicrobiales bacterium]
MALAGVIAGCGTSSSTATDAANPAVRTAAATGSDQHLVNLARDIADPATATVGSDQHLVNLAAEAARGSTG